MGIKKLGFLFFNGGIHPIANDGDVALAEIRERFDCVIPDGTLIDDHDLVTNAPWVSHARNVIELRKMARNQGAEGFGARLGPAFIWMGIGIEKCHGYAPQACGLR